MLKNLSPQMKAPLLLVTSPGIEYIFVFVVVAYSPIDVHFASASMDHTARLWTTDLTFPLRLFAGHTSHINVGRYLEYVGGVGS